jgi:hypothetical protein
MRFVIVKHVAIRLKCGSGSTEQIWIKYGTDGDKMHPFDDVTS